MTRSSDGRSAPHDFTDGHLADPLGTRALYSQPQIEPPAFGSVSVDCSRCQRTSIVGISRAARLLVGSLTLPMIRGDYPTLLRCPACDRRAWVRLSIRL